MTRTHRWFSCVGLVLVPASLCAQSLGDVARKEEERRRLIAAPAKVYTNEQLPLESVAPGPVPAPSSDPAPAPQPSTESAGGQKADKPASADVARQKPAEADPQKTEAYWRQRLEKSRSDLARAETLLAAMQSRINALTADFVNRDDPAQRAVIESDRVKALEELDRLKQEIDVHSKAIASTEEDARRAGVPAGWVR